MCEAPDAFSYLSLSLSLAHQVGVRRERSGKLLRRRELHRRPTYIGVELVQRTPQKAVLPRLQAYRIRGLRRRVRVLIINLA